MLAALVAAPDRHMIIVTGMESEGWNNTEGQCLAYVASQPAWDLLGAGDQNNMIVHRNGHAILDSDMQQILDYCDVHLLGKAPADVSTDFTQMKGNLFLHHNRQVLDPLFAPYLDK
jgi:endo-1,4-beta-xylanase